MKKDETLEKEMPEEETTVEETVSETEILEEKVKTLEEENAKLTDQMLRQRADLENYRKRLIREKEDAVLFANTRLIEDLLQFLDNLERAISAAKNGGSVEALAEGVEMIRDQLLSSLEKNWGLEKIDPKGCEFNPDEHEACMATVDPELKTETVLDVLQNGYKLHSRVIRPAKVRIGKPE
jgi:molecular chaperone GrpE